MTVFGQISDPAVKEKAQSTVESIKQYQYLISQAKQSDPPTALTFYKAAQKINQNVPDNLTQTIEDLQRTVEAQNKPPVVVTPPVVQTTQPAPVVATTTPKSTPPKPQDDSVKIAQLLADARSAESDGKLPIALARFQAMLVLQPGNADATAGVTRVQQKISSDPQQLKLTLVGAIRDFYDSKLSDAKAALGFYLNTPQARSAGAAYFFLGATLLEQSLLTTPQTKTPASPPVPDEVSTNFQRARAAGYKPLPQYVSPVLMKAWNSTGS